MKEIKVLLGGRNSPNNCTYGDNNIAFPTQFLPGRQDRKGTARWLHGTPGTGLRRKPNPPQLCANLAWGGLNAITLHLQCPPTHTHTEVTPNNAKKVREHADL